MNQIDQILKRISIFYYIFVGLFILGGVYSFVVAFVNAANRPSISFEGASVATLISLLVFSILLTFVAVWTIVIFVKLLIVIGRSIARHNIFSLRTVRIINRYAILNTALLVMVMINDVIMSQYVDTDPHIYTDMITSASSMVMLLMFAQVLKIGYLLKQEQELTI